MISSPWKACATLSTSRHQVGYQPHPQMTIHGFGLLDSPSDGNLCPSCSKLQILNPFSLKATLRFAVYTIFGTCLLLCVRSVWAMSRGSLLYVCCSVQNAAAPQFSSQTAKKEFEYVPSASPTPKDLVRTGRSLAFPNSGVTNRHE